MTAGGFGAGRTGARRSLGPALALAALLAATGGLGGCVGAGRAPAAWSCPSAAGVRPMLRAELLFGLDIPGGGRVSPDAWRDFLDARVTPRFPDGLTVLDGDGRWLDAARRQTHEPSKLVLIVAEDGPATLAGLQAIRTDYRSAFRQESVGLVLTRACAGF